MTLLGGLLPRESGLSEGFGGENGGGFDAVRSVWEGVGGGGWRRGAVGLGNLVF